MVKIIKRTTAGLLTLCVIAISQGVARAQEPVDRMARPAVRASAEAVIIAKPDQAQIDIGIVTQAPSAKTAADQNAKQIDFLINALRKLLGQDADIKTISYQLTPNYVYPREGGQPRISGYSASNIVQVKTSDLARVGDIIDTAYKSGANSIHSLQFNLKDDEAVRAQALREAAAKAKAKTEAMASALGLKIVRVLFAEESGPTVRPVYAAMEMAQAKAGNVQTPVEPGTIEVRAIVTLTVEVGQ
ncbi:MAG TPA: SIMPL domain-containing protein [Blastocatellia bacterium]|nr:SIMPL domain-containing protein [Blastocatellia bacterium]